MIQDSRYCFTTAVSSILTPFRSCTPGADLWFSIADCQAPTGPSGFLFAFIAKRKAENLIRKPTLLIVPLFLQPEAVSVAGEDLYLCQHYINTAQTAPVANRPLSLASTPSVERSTTGQGSRFDYKGIYR